jgi:hypothetical protein
MFGVVHWWLRRCAFAAASFVFDQGGCMSHIFTRAFSVLLLAALTCVSAFAQGTADVYTAGRPHGPNDQYLAPFAGVFAASVTGTLAPNHGQSNIVGPSRWQWDASIARTFQIREGQRVEARVEAFNVMNSFRATNPSANITGGTYGLIRDSQAPRDMQFAVRYIF